MLSCLLTAHDRDVVVVVVKQYNTLCFHVEGG